jgi:cytochrome c oxidase subunit 2
MKQDAVPGIPTTMWFTPKYTTKEMKQKYGPDFEYEISCQEMCGKGHYSMRGVVIVETEAEYRLWLASKSRSTYWQMPAARRLPAERHRRQLIQPLLLQEIVQP